MKNKFSSNNLRLSNNNSKKEEKVKWFKAGNTVRSTQSISFSKLIKDFGFKICTVDRSTEDVKKLIGVKFKKLKNIPDNLFINKFDVENYIK